jgi:hypothetical protein
MTVSLLHNKPPLFDDVWRVELRCVVTREDAPRGALRLEAGRSFLDDNIQLGEDALGRRRRRRDSKYHSRRLGDTREPVGIHCPPVEALRVFCHRSVPVPVHFIFDGSVT